MKVFGIVFLMFVGIMVYKTAQASTLPVHQYAYCSGYADAMAKTYRMKYYYKMQKFFENQVKEQDNLTSEYYQSGVESVKPKTAIADNLKEKCEVQFKGKT